MSSVVPRVVDAEGRGLYQRGNADEWMIWYVPPPPTIMQAESVSYLRSKKEVAVLLGLESSTLKRICTEPLRLKMLDYLAAPPYRQLSIRRFL
jgi:hypothetical protein